MIAISGLGLGTMITSCDKMIEVETPSNLLASEQVFESVQTANAALSGLYADLWDNSPLSGDKTGLILSLYTDDLNYYSLSANNGLMEYYQNAVIDSNPVVSSYWTNAYQKVYMANSIIEGAEHSSAIMGEEKSRIIAEALLIRSIVFFYLQQIYGDIPYPVTTNYQINQVISKTASVEVLKRIEADLKEAILGLKDSYRNTERIFPNKKTAQLMLAKILVEEKKYFEAEQLLKEVLQSPLYSMQNDITKVFEKSGTHIFWQLKPRNTGGSTKEIQSYYFTNSAPVSVALSLDLVNSFASGDLRRQNWITSMTVGANTWHRANKYKMVSNNTTEYSIVFRLEEAYLLLAESLAQQNKVQEAIPYLNVIKQRSNTAPVMGSISQQILIDEIIKENRKEFFTEMGNRFFVLKRMGKLNTLTAVKPNWKSHFHKWPLPQKELLLNANLNPQNDGY